MWISEPVVGGDGAGDGPGAGLGAGDGLGEGIGDGLGAGDGDGIGDGDGTGEGTPSTQWHMFEGQYGEGALQLLWHQLSMSEFPIQAPIKDNDFIILFFLLSDSYQRLCNPLKALVLNLYKSIDQMDNMEVCGSSW